MFPFRVFDCWVQCGAFVVLRLHYLRLFLLLSFRIVLSVLFIHTHTHRAPHMLKAIVEGDKERVVQGAKQLKQIQNENL